MLWNLERVRERVREAVTEELLDDATVYRAGMEAESLDLIEQELHARGVTREAIAEHERKRREAVLFDAAGIALKCQQCRRPAVGEGRGWHYLWGRVPLFRRRFVWCAEHAPKNT